MKGKWVDSTAYFGPDRRARAAGLRLKERRRSDAAGEPPSLAALLRRLRIRVSDMSSAEDLRQAQNLARAAVLQAEAHKNKHCADILRGVAQALARCDFRNGTVRADLDARLLEAQLAA